MVNVDIPNSSIVYTDDSTTKLTEKRVKQQN